MGVPTFTVDHPFTVSQGEAMGRITSGGSEAILFGRTTWEESGPAWTSRDMAADPAHRSQQHAQARGLRHAHRHQLVRAVLADGLVDELHLFVYPLALGAGPRLFPEGAPATTLALVDSEALDNGVVHLTYCPVDAV